MDPADVVRRTRPGVLSTMDEVKYWYNVSGKRIGKRYTYNVQVACNDSLPIEWLSTPVPGEDGMLLSSDSGILDSGMQLLPDSGMQLNSALPPGNCTQQQSALTGYYYFGNDLVAEYSGSGYTGGVLSANYIYANGERVARFTTLNDINYYLTDHLGSVLCMIDQTGRVKNKTLYRPYGEVHADEVTKPDAHKYTGHLRDEELGSQWDYLGARYYIPKLKLFSQVDPARGAYPGLSPYGYCAGNPMKYVDPDGEVWLDAIVDIGGALWDVYEFFKEPSWGNAGAVGLDVGAALVPGVVGPGGARLLGKLLSKADDVADGLKAVDKAVDAGKAVDKTVDAAKGAEKTAEAGKQTSQIDRAAFKPEREAYWKAEAKNNPGKYSPENVARMEKGNAPLGPDGHPIELHHLNRTPDGGVTPMSRTDHRVGENYKKNHPSD